MTKAGIRLIFRSKETEEVEIGEYRYRYTVSPLLIARISAKTFSIEDDNSVNQNVKSKLKFDVLLPNDASDRVNRISHILYMGTFYKVGAIRPYPPRVALTVEDIEISELKSELEQRLSEATRKSQNDLKIESFDQLGVLMDDVPDKDSLPKGALVLIDNMIQVWDGNRFITLLEYISSTISNTSGNNPNISNLDTDTALAVRLMNAIYADGFAIIDGLPKKGLPLSNMSIYIDNKQYTDHVDHIFISRDSKVYSLLTYILSSKPPLDADIDRME